MTTRERVHPRRYIGVLTWGLTGPLAHAALPTVAPLRQATAVVTVNLLVTWLWTRWRGLPVFGHREGLLPGLGMGLLLSFRFGLCGVAAALLGGSGFLVMTLGPLALLRAAMRRDAIAAVVIVAALVAGLLSHAPVPATVGLLGGILWAVEAMVRSSPTLARISGGAWLDLHELAVAAVVLPVASVMAGDNWLASPGSFGWTMLALEVAVGVAYTAARWWEPALRRDPLRHVVPLAPLLAWPIGYLVGTDRAPMTVGAAALLSVAGFLLLRRRPSMDAAAPAEASA